MYSRKAHFRYLFAHNRYVGTRFNNLQNMPKTAEYEEARRGLIFQLRIPQSGRLP